MGDQWNEPTTSTGGLTLELLVLVDPAAGGTFRQGATRQRPNPNRQDASGGGGRMEDGVYTSTM